MSINEIRGLQAVNGVLCCAAAAGGGGKLVIFLLTVPVNHVYQLISQSIFKVA